MAKKHFIQTAIKHKGKLHKDLHVPIGQKIPEAKLHAAEKRPGAVGKRARLAETLEHMHHGKKK